MIQKCKKGLKSTLVNIVDLIGAQTTGSLVKVWEDFSAFHDYTLDEGCIIHKEEARKRRRHFSVLPAAFETKSLAAVVSSSP